MCVLSSNESIKHLFFQCCYARSIWSVIQLALNIYQSHSVTNILGKWILTKDNLARRNWNGSKACVFFHQDETIKYLFFQYRFARSIWSVIQVASTLFPPRSITNIFGNWLNRINNRFKKHIRVGAITFIWSFWLCRNDKVFNDKNSSILQVIYRGTNNLRLWSSLQRVENRDLFTEVCTRLEATARDTFSQHVWPHCFRIVPSV
jgi:hypothetical protein